MEAPPSEPRPLEPLASPNRPTDSDAVSRLRAFLTGPALLLPAVLLLALLVRLPGLGFDIPTLSWTTNSFPLTHHADEPVNQRVVRTVLSSGDFNPRFFNYPSLFFYLHALLHVVAYGIARALGAVPAPAEGMSFTRAASTISESTLALLLSRGLSVAFGVGSVYLLYVAGKRLISPRAGLAAAFLLAVSPTFIRNTRFFSPDACTTFFVLLTLVCALDVLRRGSLRDHLLTGAAVGLAASTKYNAGLLLVLPLAAQLLREGAQGLKDRRLYLGFVMAAAAFVATSPFTVLDFPAFLEGFKKEVAHYTTGHLGAEGNSGVWYARYLWLAEGPVVLLGFVGLVWSYVRRSRELTLLSIFPLVYLPLISRMAYRNDRTVMLVLPFLFLFALVALQRLAGWGPSERLQRPARRIGAVALALLSITLPLLAIVDHIPALGMPAPRAQARQWFEDNVPTGQRIALEWHSAVPRRSAHYLVPLRTLSSYDLAWYRENRVSYFISSEEMTDRFYDDPERHADTIARYEALFGQLERVAVFPNPYRPWASGPFARLLGGDRDKVWPGYAYNGEQRIYRMPKAPTPTP
ncbi:glycosyltransferase family 39 protein [Chondromyces crocatus]|uniref:Glycosyltransferase RgtA/B/C/D-like domain-containing protein n=1 Tax=Chondromyces crocatus TaxID=52 RepID=A0A0K1ENA9_CHOCO|nr:glycosyltransferase family 39 protein [Chondromyces crocatus]AKT42117.1 uncharacterized protein CMC5_063400 [Chondromyces crocatus]